MNRRGLLLVLLACATTLVVVLVLATRTPIVDVERAPMGSGGAGRSSTEETRLEQPSARAQRPRAGRARSDVPPPASRATEPPAAPNLRASADIDETNDPVSVTATIRPDDPIGDAKPVSFSMTMEPATTRLTVMLGVAPDPGTLRVSGEMQLTTHTADGIAMQAGVATTDPELLKVDEAGVVSGISNSFGSARQSAGECKDPGGKVVGHTTTWARIRITFGVRGKPYAVTLSVPNFEAGRPRRLEVLDGSREPASHR